MALALLPTLHPSPLPSIITESVAAAMEQSKGSRVSLPSITNLIKAANEASETERSPKEDLRRISAGSQNYSHNLDRQLSAGSPRSHLPPTPPLPHNFDYARHSPINSSPTSAVAPHGSYYSHPPPTSNSEFYASRNSAYPPLPDENNHWPPPHYNHSPTDPSGPETLSRQSASVYPDLPDEKSQFAGLAHQRPLPENFPPPPPPPPTAQAPPPIDPQMGQAYQYHQHHHSFPQNTAVPYQQNQERYVCSICNKPFSRPSSLKIHTYSHTGEKPYKCKVEGCNKYFSVRSNMKRHEKGCHGGESNSTGGNSPSTA